MFKQETILSSLMNWLLRAVLCVCVCVLKHTDSHSCMCQIAYQRISTLLCEITNVSKLNRTRTHARTRTHTHTSHTHKAAWIPP